MIDRVSGVVTKVEPMAVVVDVGGIAFRLTVPVSTSSRVTAGTKTALWAELLVREDSMTLFGFASEKERAYFNLLRSVAGVGPKLACTVLSGASVEGLNQAVTKGEPGMLSRIPGIGRKTAGRIIMELSGKIETALQPAGAPGLPSVEATEALMSLGYPRNVAARAVEKVLPDLGPDTSVEDVVRAALRPLAISGRKGTV
ncbi:Holliday junction branch migration protein RuvA [Candidatus Fermentibacteria bacterium]|nr:Holliday junction branch migration protein RuvA [Candidatus Fermentibacteria bacterium]